MPLTPDDVQMIAGIVAQMRVGTLPPYLLSQQLEVQQSVSPQNPVRGTQLVGSNSNRVLLIISGTTLNADVDLVPIGIFNVAGVLKVSFSNNPFIITVQQHGVLPQLAWFAGSNYNGFIYILEMIWRPASQ